MAGWRDAVSDEAQDDLDELTEAAVDFALRQLDANAGFVPFALAVGAGGDKQVIQPNYLPDTDPDAAEQLEAQWDAVGEVKGALRAVAVAVDVVLPEKGTDAIELVIEHREGIAIGMVFPYHREAGGEHEAESPSAHSVARRVWV